MRISIKYSFCSPADLRALCISRLGTCGHQQSDPWGACIFLWWAYQTLLGAWLANGLDYCARSAETTGHRTGWPQEHVWPHPGLQYDHTGRTAWNTIEDATELLWRSYRRALRKSNRNRNQYMYSDSQQWSRTSHVCQSVRLYANFFYLNNMHKLLLNSEHYII